MIVGHGDDLWRFGRPIVANFSSNVYGGMDLTALKEHLARRLEAISHYPEPEPYTLEKALAELHGIAPECVCVTNGATEAIYLIAQAWRGARSNIQQPTFSEYADACLLHGHTLYGGDLFWLCNPNNPDGSVVPKAQLEERIAANPDTVFIIDQSYGFFTEEPLMTPSEAVAKGNVLQLHSMTKRYAMPGLRLGYIIGDQHLIDKIRAARMPWSVNALAIEAGLYLAAHPDTAPIDKAALLKEAQRLREVLNAIPGISVEPTKTHFMLCRIEMGTAASLKKYLAEVHGLLIRDASNFEGLTPGHFRIAAQTPEQNDLLINAIRQYLK